MLEKKYKPNRDYLVYYPVVEGIAVAEVSKAVNDKLRNLSLAYGAGTGEARRISAIREISPYPSSARICWCWSSAVIISRSALHMVCLPGSMSISTCAPANSTRSATCSSPAANMCRSSVTLSASRLQMIRSIPTFFPDTYKGITADQPFYVDAQALYLYFAPYEIAPYSAGFPTFRIPYAEIMGLISTEGEFWQSFSLK
ncbi:RsiV family protein [Paenibacillus rhizoplanae]